MSTGLSGVIAAIATAVDERCEPDCMRSVKLARYLLDHGCDGLNVLGTTGEATSFSVAQRQQAMRAYRDAGLPLQRMMVGTGAAALADAVALTREAAELGFAGALVLPPFYYKGVSDGGLIAYVETLAAATAARPIPLYLYHFPSMSGLAWGLPVIARLLRSLGERIAGLKDSSGDLAYARAAAALSPDFQVFPSNEAVLLEARSGPFAGCISATANLNADLCARGFRCNDQAALQRAVAIRALFEGKPLVPGIKALLAHIHHDEAWARVMPPLARLSDPDRGDLLKGYENARQMANAFGVDAAGRPGL